MWPRSPVFPRLAGRALGGYGSISEDSRQRVEQAATKLGYQTNAVAGRSPPGTTKASGWCRRHRKSVLRNCGPRTFRCSSGSRLLHRGSGKRRRKTGTWNVRRSRFSTPARSTVWSSLPRPVRTRVRSKLGNRIPLVVIDRDLPGLDVDSVLVDNVAGSRQRDPASGQSRPPRNRAGYRAARHLVGCERIQGYEQVLEENGLRLPRPYERKARPDLKAACSLPLELLNSPIAPTRFRHHQHDDRSGSRGGGGSD